MTRQYTAKKDGVVVRNGTFDNEELLRIDFPEGEYELILDQLLYPEKPVPNYQELRQAAYPPMEEFADALFWQQQGDETKMTAYLAKCEAVKTMYPKPLE